MVCKLFTNWDDPPRRAPVFLGVGYLLKGFLTKPGPNMDVNDLRFLF